MTEFLQRYLNIRPYEILPLFLAALYFFCILTALMVLRPTRDALGLESGVETVRWLFMGTLVATLFVNPVFGFLVSRFRRLVFISATNGFFIVNLLLFCALLVLAPQAIGETTGMVFYVWMSVFNLFITMVFWALMADRFSLEEGKRLFAVIAAGGTMGAIFGSTIAWQLAEMIGSAMLLIVASAFLVLGTLAAWGVAWTQPEKPPEERDPDLPPPVDENTVIGGSAIEGFRATLRSPYLLGIAAYILILAVMITFIYFTRLQMVAALGDDVDMRTGVFAQIDLATQVATLLMQLIVAGHLMRRIGVPFTLALLPITVGLGFIGLALVSSLAVLVIFEATFRAVQRAITRPARETLYTVISREDKYKAKAFIDTFIYRGGDAIGAQTEGALARLGMGLYALAAVAVPLAVIWAALGLWLGRQQARLVREQNGGEQEQQSAEPATSTPY